MEMLHDDGQEEEERLGCLHDENTYRKGYMMMDRRKNNGYQRRGLKTSAS
jgi:hypothetical protein